MKVVYVLIAFTLVNVLADDVMDDFKLQVFLTNRYIQKAYNHNDANGNGLVKMIKEFVRQDHTMEELNVLFGILEHSKLEDRRLAAHLQTRLRMKIRFGLGIQVISDDPQVVDIYLNPETLNLTELAQERRNYTEKALENLIRNGLQLDRSYMGAHLPDLKYYHLCRIFAMYKNTKLLPINSSKYINNIDVLYGDGDEMCCVLTSDHENEEGSTILYAQIEDQIFQIWPDRDDREPLLSNNDHLDQGPGDN